MKKIAEITVLLSSILVSLAFGQDLQYPRLSSVEIHAAVMYNNNENMYYYSYALVNDPANTGSIDGFAVDISRNPSFLDIDTVGLRFDNDGFTEASFRRNFPHLQGRIVPVGFIATPGGTWTGALSDDLMASFDGTRSYAITPGGISRGFELMSKGIPSIRRCVVSPFFDFDSLFSDRRFPNEKDIPNTDSIQSVGKFYGWTVGPVAPPVAFGATDWIDTLSSYKHQSLALGWIKERGITTSLDQKLDNARQQLQQGDNKSAKNILEAFVNEVEALNKQGKQITSEAYALLKFNAEYLISRLQ